MPRRSLTPDEASGLVILNHFLKLVQNPKKDKAESGLYNFYEYMSDTKGKLVFVQEYKSHEKAFREASRLARELRHDIIFWHRVLISKDYAYWTGFGRTSDDNRMVIQRRV